MRPVDPAGQAILDSDHLPIAFGVRIARRDGKIFRMIAHDQDTPAIDIGFGSEVYKAMIGPDVSAMQSTSTFQADNLELFGFVDALGVSEADVRDGRFDGADVRIFYVFWSDYTIPAVEYNRYTIGDGSTLDLAYQLELRSLLDYLNNKLFLNQNIWCDTGFMGIRCGVVEDPPIWQPSTAYANANPRNAGKRDHVKPTVYNDRFFRLSTAGTSGASEPAWNLTINGTTADGSCVWITEYARLIQTTIASVTDRKKFTIAAATDKQDNLLKQGLVRATSGNNAGSKPLEIDSWTLATKEIILVEAFGRDPQVGDAVDITLACTKTIDSGALNCKGYGNIERYRGWLRMPGDHKLLNPSV